MKFNFETARFIILPSLLAAVCGFLLSHHTGTQPVSAFSAGPPAGYTGAPGEEPEACAECHVVPDAGTGHITISAPQTYIPGQTYQITVTHTNTDLTRLRWGFQLSALDTSDEKAGDLQSTDVFTQILNNQGPGGARQYIEHTSVGTFQGQQNGASWTFNWTAPPTDIGFITFYAAGNQANNDGNTSGDYIYKTFVTAAPASATPDFAVSVSPSSRSVVPGGAAQYSFVVTPLAGFTGEVGFTISGLPNSTAVFTNPATINITDASSKTLTVTVQTLAAIALGDYPITFKGTAGTTVHTAPALLRVVSPNSADLSVVKTASPNPGQAGVNLAYRITATNNGPAAATNVNVTDTLPAGLIFVSSATTQGTCIGSVPVNCNVGNLAVGASAIITIVAAPTVPGQVVNTASVDGGESDFESSNDTASVTTLIQPAAVSPTMLDPNLVVSTLVSGLDQPTSLAFLGANDLLVLEKASGKVQRIVNGTLHSTALDLPVNSASERGLLGIALHSQFASNHFVYLYWSESKTGIDTLNIDDIALLGNRVDRYVWNGTTLTFDRNLIKLRALQEDANQPHRGNHNGGVLRFGQDGKLYILMGDNGRRGFLQNITSGGPVPDDQFGGPEPDDAHLTGVVLRLNDDGSTPTDNPFFSVNSGLSGEAAANVKKVYAYGVRNGFGMAIDPLSGSLWTQENGDDAFDEMNRVQAGFNGGWTQVIGPVSRIAEYKSIESTYAAGNLQQLRWPPGNIADTPPAALARLYMLPGAQYTDPEFSWKYAVAPAAIGFVKGRGLGQQFEGDMFVGASRTTLLNGYLFRFKFTPDRLHFSFADPNLADRVADNSDKFDLAESESLVVGRDFGVATDIQTGPNGNVFVVSLSNGAVYQIAAKPFREFRATLTGAQEVPANNSTATGNATIILDSSDGTMAHLSLNFAGLPTAQVAAHIHGPAPPGTNASVAVGLPLGQLSDFPIALTPAQVQQLKAGLLYLNVHTTAFQNGEIRGQFLAQPATEIRTWTTQGRTYALVKLTFPDGSYRVANWGGVARTGNDFTVDPVIERTTAASLPVSAEDAQIYDLGPLTTGSYTFTLRVSGVVVRSQEFIVSTIPPLPNPIDDQRQFVRQQYLDFLNREPDQAGWDFWTDNITKCSDPARRPPGQTEAQCIDRQRETTSAAFFLSPEFQYTGYFVYRMYQGALGRQPKLSEFIPDAQFVGNGIIVNGQLSAAKINQNKADFAAQFENCTDPAKFRCAEFKAIYDGLNNTQYVDKLFEMTGVNASATDRVDLVNSIGASQTRATVLQKVVDGINVISEGNQQFTTTYGHAFYDQQFNRAFVQLEYFGYLRRDPDVAGYAFWLGKLNLFGNYLDAEMVKAFITSPEYRSRFGSP